MKKSLALFLALLMVMLMFCSCGSEKKEMDSGWNNNPSQGESTGGDVSKDSSENSPDRKIIKTFRLEMETLEYERAITSITSLAESLGGYIAESSADGGTRLSDESSSGSRRATYTVRIPSNKVEEYVERISEECNVRSSKLTTEDVTDSYYGIKAQLDSLRAQEARLGEMIGKAASLGELITLEDKLTQIRSKINELNSRLQLMDKSVDYSYVYITLYEVQKYKPVKAENYFSRVGRAFTGAFETFAVVVGDIFVGLIWILPFLLVGGAITVMIIAMERKKKKKRSAKYQNPENDNKK